MSGQFAHGLTTQTQEITCDRLAIQGEVPTWLTGSLLRNGPAQFEVSKQNFRHWFDGLAMLHSFTFNEGNVAYANKFLQSPAYLKAQETGKICYQEFATDPCRSIFKRITSVFQPLEPGGNSNVNISRFGESFVALTELPPCQVHSELNRYTHPFRGHSPELAARCQLSCHWPQAILRRAYEIRTQVLARVAHFRDKQRSMDCSLKNRLEECSIPCFSPLHYVKSLSHPSGKTASHLVCFF